MRTRESAATLWVARVCASRAGSRGVRFVDLILSIQRGVSDGVSLLVSGGVSRFLFL